MGITWKVAMPFLSTLAALVIIVHSTEEDTESDYRRDLRPRVLDTGTPIDDQPWRVVDQKTMIQKSTQSEAWNDNSSEEPPKRRRFGRKRKRRPQSSLNEDQLPQDRYGYPEEPIRPYFEVETPNARQTTETVKRRRKKLDGRPIEWTEEPLELERPLRRRGQRRKRPSLESWPELSEFNGYNTADTPNGITTGTDTHLNNDDIKQEQASKSKDNQIEENPLNTGNDNAGITEQTPLGEESDNPLPNGFSLPPQENDYEFLGNKPELQEDKSLSEFSIEVMTHAHEPQSQEGMTKLQSKLREKITGVFNEHDKSMDKFSLGDYSHQCVNDFITPIKPHPDVNVNYETLKFEMLREKVLEKVEQSSTIKFSEHNRRPPNLNKCRDKLQTRSAGNGPIDPVTLKDILKRSNGSSLSEILQQHNLTLTDLLRGKEDAISVFKSENTFEYRRRPIPDILADSGKEVKEININVGNTKYKEEETDFREKQLSYSIRNETIDLLPLNSNSELPSFHEIKDAKKTTEDEQITTTTEKPEIVTQKIMTRIRFPTGMRKKLRMRPMMNTTYKAQLSRDLIALNARKYIHHRRNNTKSKEWKNILPSLTNKTLQQMGKTHADDHIGLNHMPEDITTQENFGLVNNSAPSGNDNKENPFEVENLNIEVTTQTSTTTKVIVMEIFTNVTAEKGNMPRLKQTGTMPVNRRQPFNYRKKKRNRQKISTTQPPQENVIKDAFGINDFDPSDIMSRPNNLEITGEVESFPTNLEDFLTTRPSHIHVNNTRPVKSVSKFSATTPTVHNSAEESAKIEIDEILNDIGASARLSKILGERNMTLSELVEHRERGSSHVHLADIFHNASKEPNPPEPFLSKSLLEPISKETYPLRAILEANLHDATLKATTIEPSMAENNYVNIPGIMNFGSNVNENAENMGIMSLFSNFTRFNVNNNNNVNTTANSIAELNTETIPPQVNNTGTNLRESRILSDVVSRDNQDDVASWTEIFSLMRKNYKNETKDILETYQEETTSLGEKKITLEDDNGDGLIVLEDLQHLKDFDSNIAPVSDEKLEYDSMERTDAPSGILEKLPSQTKSVTVATASIAGLAIVLFLLTYAAFKWKQQKGISSHKHKFSEERVPTPVFESRKGHKSNSSNRSISPMLSTSNIYTLNTLDSRNGKESPEYMWDTLRKPFQ